MMNMWDIVLIGFLMGLLTMSCYYIFKQIVKAYKYIIKGKGLF